MLTIAFLGPENTNTHLAAVKRFGKKGRRYLHEPTVEEVFHAVERRRADYGVVPVENSLGGAVTHTLDRFVDMPDTPVRVLGEIDQPIEHGLILHTRSPLSRIRVVYSHPQALEQCSAWLHGRLPAASCSETDSTAEAVRRVIRERDDRWLTLWKLNERAAIGPKELGRRRGLKWIRIPQDRENRTRFLVLGRGKRHRSSRCKTSLYLALKDRPGALHAALAPFRRERINLTKIESRPSRRKAWEYVFFIDFEGHEEEPRVRRALGSLRRTASDLRVLGSYPVGTRR